MQAHVIDIDGDATVRVIVGPLSSDQAGALVEHLVPSVFSTDESGRARVVRALPREPDPELVAAANRYLHAGGGRDAIRPGQLATYLRWLGAESQHPTLAALRGVGVDLRDVAGVPGLRRSKPELARIDAEFVPWAQQRQAREGFPKAHIWIRGFAATALAVEDRAGSRR
jgi:hypothetical protein